MEQSFILYFCILVTRVEKNAFVQRKLKKSALARSKNQGKSRGMFSLIRYSQKQILKNVV